MEAWSECSKADVSQDFLRTRKLNTQLPALIRSDSTEEPQSVIHAPSGFKGFNENGTDLEGEERHSPTESSKNRLVSPTTPEAAASPNDKVRVTVVFQDSSNSMQDDAGLAEYLTPKFVKCTTEPGDQRFAVIVIALR